MIDAVEPITMPSTTQATECPTCSTEFSPNRKGQRFCSRDCQRNTARGARSGELKDRSWRHYERASRLAETIYTTPPSERLGLMKNILEIISQDAGLRNILTDPKLLRATPRADSRKWPAAGFVDTGLR